MDHAVGSAGSPATATAPGDTSLNRSTSSAPAVCQQKGLSPLSPSLLLPGGKRPARARRSGSDSRREEESGRHRCATGGGTRPGEAFPGTSARSAPALGSRPLDSGQGVARCGAALAGSSSWPRSSACRALAPASAPAQLAQPGRRGLGRSSRNVNSQSRRGAAASRPLPSPCWPPLCRGEGSSGALVHPGRVQRCGRDGAL